jgi:alpha-D-ribose 1-methylphosphonate 5-triphosphate synthase subunit PhnG
MLVRLLVRWLVSPHDEILRKLLTWKTGYVTIASRRGEERGNHFAARLVTVTRSLLSLEDELDDNESNLQARDGEQGKIRF